MYCTRLVILGLKLYIYMYMIQKPFCRTWALSSVIWADVCVYYFPIYDIHIRKYIELIHTHTICQHGTKIHKRKLLFTGNQIQEAFSSSTETEYVWMYIIDTGCITSEILLRPLYTVQTMDMGTYIRFNNKIYYKCLENYFLLGFSYVIKGATRSEIISHNFS